MRKSPTPVIDTERLVLRAHTLDDFAACSSMWADPTVVRFIGGEPSSSQQAWARMLGYAGHWLLMGFGYWAIEERKTGHFIGEVGFADFKRDMSPTIAGLPEIGWALAPFAHGQGYATEAIKAVVSWGDGNLASSSTVCLIDPQNRASANLAPKFGYRILREAVYKGQTLMLYGRDRPHG